jgi:hypothetical protein
MAIDLTTLEISNRIREVSGLLLAGCDEQRAQAVRFAESDRLYRIARARAYLQSEQKTVDAKKYESDLACEQTRFDALLQENLLQAELEHVRSLRSVLSALQSLANATRAEAEFSRTGPQYDR